MRLGRFVLVMMATLMLFVSAAYAAPAVAPTKDAFGFPLWYQDGLTPGTRTEPCLDAADPNCIVLADAFFDPLQPLVFPTNFPGEFFYFVADSDKITTPGCPGVFPPLAKGAFTRVALEGSFVTGAPIPGDQITFARIRIVVKPGGLCPNTQYAFTHPYGTELITTHADGGVPANKTGFTEDIGCLGAPCDFGLALTSRVLTGFLSWDPAVAPLAPAGYLGDAVTLHSVIGSPNNVFSIAQGGTVLASTNLFTVSGKLAGPLMASPSAVDFGGQTVGTTSVPALIVTVTNVNPTAITPAAATITGTNALDFAVSADGCVGVALAQDASCTISMTFSPTLVAVESATLNVPHNGPFRSPLTVALIGTGTAAGAAPVATLSAVNLAFGPQRVRTASATQTVTLSNTGTAPLGVTVAIVNATDPVTGLPPAAADQFAIASDSCSGTFVAAGASCAVSVKFAPTVSAASTALLSFTDNAAGSPQSVTLTGTGTGGIAAVSAATDPITGFPNWYQDENGVQVQPCLDTTDPTCVILADAFFNPLQPLVFPTNFPGEFFYFVADSDSLSFPACSGAVAGKAKYRAALEGSFLNGAPIAGEDITFARTKIVASGLCPNTTYAFTTPYGTDLVTTDASGAVVANKKGATIDIGCAAVPCNFSEALSSRVLGGFIKWDPAVPPAAPAGHLGDGNVGTLHPVIGSPFIPAGETAPANFFRIADLAGNVIAQTNLFTVAGKLAVPIQTSQAFAAGPVTFPPTNVGTASVPQTVTLTNADPLNSVSIGAATFLAAVGGIPSLDFSTATDTCSGASLPAGGSCTIGVVFTPTVGGQIVAVLQVPHGGLNTPAQVPLSGTGIAANQPPVAVNDSATTPAATAVTINVLANDSDPDGNLPLTVANLTQPAAGAGTAVLNADNTVTYTPAAGFAGTASFTYQAVDSLGALSNVAFVTITVQNAVNQPPVAANDIATTAQRTAVNIAVLANDSDPDGNLPLTVANLTQPAVGTGTAALQANNTVTYTPPAGFVGQASFTYQARDSLGALSNVATVTVTVPNQAPVAVNDNATTTTGTAVNINLTANDSDPDGNTPLTVVNLTQPAAGTGTVNSLGSTSATYTPPAGFTGTATFTYQASDTLGALSNVATVTVTVTPVVVVETINATASASRNKQLTAASWTVNGTTSVITPVHTMTVTLTRTGALIGTATTDTKGRWKVSAAKSTVVPVVGDTITVTSSLSTTQTFAVTVK